MAKKELDKERHYKKIIQKQKAIIQDLKRKSGRVIKEESKYESLDDESFDLEEFEDAIIKCPKCGKGKLEFVDLKVRKIFVCSVCPYRQVKK